MDERMRFVIRLKDGESMASLCRECGIPGKLAIRSLSVTSNADWRVSAIAPQNGSGEAHYVTTALPDLERVESNPSKLLN
jgi:hypothetical protein